MQTPVAPIENAITASEYLSREDMSLVFHKKTDVTTFFTAYCSNKALKVSNKIAKFVPIETSKDYGLGVIRTL